MENKKFVIIDAMALAYKAYFAFISRPLVTSKGEPTSAVYGFITQLLKVIEEQKPDYIAVAFDSKEKTFRHDIYKDYKASREKMPDDMIPQIGRIKDIIEALNIPLYILPKYEADDIIGTAVKLAEKKGLKSYVITPDKDYNQMITANTFIVRSNKSSNDITIYDENKMLEDFGFSPKQMIDYLALVGDSSDDIPGVAGIGPKGATELIKKFGTVENIYENINEIEKAGIKNKLEANKDNAILSKELATIHCDVPIEFDFNQTKFTIPNFDSLRSIFLELEFSRLYQRLLSVYGQEQNEEVSAGKSKVEFDKEKTDYQLITELKEAQKLADKLKESSLFVFDTETDGLNYLDLNIAGVSFSTKAGEGFFIPLNPLKNKDDLFSKNLDDRIAVENFVNIFKSIFENKNIKKVCQNGKYDIGVLRSIGINTNNFYFDTMVASYILDPDQKHGMDALAEKYLNYKTISISEIIGNKKDAAKIFDVELEELKNYASEDADVTFRLYEVFKKELEKEDLNDIAYNVDFPLVPVLEDIEREGINVDKKTLNDLSKELQNLLENLTKDIYELSGIEFNINSPKQLQEILFNKLGLPLTKKTKTGHSTDARSLEYLRGQHDIIGLLIDYRQLSKLKSTYADSLPTMINPATGRIHTTLNQVAASTGRLASNDPNLQNIPIRTERGKEIRKAFVSRDKDHVILSADYSQIELRIMASICGDEGLLRAFKNGEDIHKSTASLVFMVEPEDVTDDMRRKAKEVNFGILYGIGPFGLSTRLGITQKHAKEIIETYFNTFKKVKNYMEDTVTLAKGKGYAETLLGRRRYLKNINSSNRVVRQFEERVAINMPIQGTAADMIKLAMINIHNELNKKQAKTKMILQVHDELLFDAHKDEVDELLPVIKNLMENAMPMDVPILVDAGIGDNWLDAH